MDSAKDVSYGRSHLWPLTKRRNREFSMPVDEWFDRRFIIIIPFREHLSKKKYTSIRVHRFVSMRFKKSYVAPVTIFTDSQSLLKALRRFKFTSGFPTEWFDDLQGLRQICISILGPAHVWIVGNSLVKDRPRFLLALNHAHHISLSHSSTIRTRPLAKPRLSQAG